METQKFEIVKTQSNVAWTGRKVTGAHNGTIDIKEGSLNFSNDQLTDGKFIIDTTSIKVLDVTDPSTNAQFAGHLASDDFFSSARYPTAFFEITSAYKQTESLYKVYGNLTIKRITQPVNFMANIIFKGETVKATGKLVIDRTKYDIKFRSGNFFQNLGDTLIYNDFDLDIQLTAKAVPSAVLV